MNQHSKIVNRRDFLRTTAGLTLGADDRARCALAHRRRCRRRAGGLAPNVWLTIAPDGTITIVSPAAEMGQGTFTSAAGHHRRRARRRLDEGQAGLPAGLGRQEIRQSGIQRAPSRPRPARRCAATSSRCALPARRRGACCSMRWRRNGACRSASLRPSRASSCTRRRAGASAMARSPPLRRAPAELPKIEDKDLKPTGELPPHRQGRAARRRAAQGHGRRHIRHGCAGARHGLRRGAAIALSGRRAADGRRRRARARCRASPTS